MDGSHLQGQVCAHSTKSRWHPVRFGLEFSRFKRQDSVEAGGKKVGHKSKLIFTSWKYEIHKRILSSAEDAEVVGEIVIDLYCDTNCLALGLKKRGNKMSRYISVENNEQAKMVAQAANVKTDEFCSIDHE